MLGDAADSSRILNYFQIFEVYFSDAEHGNAVFGQFRLDFNARIARDSIALIGAVQPMGRLPYVWPGVVVTGFASISSFLFLCKNKKRCFGYLTQKHDVR